MSLAAKVVRGSALNALDLLVRIAVMFFMTPFMLECLGMAGYGAWVVLTTAVSFLDLLDGGITLSGTRFLARNIGGKDATGYADTAGTLAWLYHRVGWLCLAGTVGLVVAAPWFANEGVNYGEAQLVLAVLGGSMALRFFLRIHLVVLKSQVRYDLIVIAGLAKVAVQSGLIVLVLLKGHGLVMLAVVQIASEVLDQFLVVLFSRRTGLAPFKAVLAGRGLLLEVLKYSATTFLNTLGQSLRSRIAPLVLTNSVGATSVPVYAVGLRLLNLLFDLVNAAMGGTLLAAFSQIEARGGIAMVREKYLSSLRFSGGMAFFGAVGLYSLGPSLLVRWLGEGFSQSGTILRLLVVPHTLWLMQFPAGSLFLSLGKHATLARLTFLGGAVNLGLAVILVKWAGLDGVAWASAVELSLFYGIVVPFVVCRLIGMSVLEYYRLLLGVPFKLALPLGLMVWLMAPLIAPDYVKLAVAALLLTLVFGICAPMLILSPSERARVASRMRSLFGSQNPT